MMQQQPATYLPACRIWMFAAILLLLLSSRAAALQPAFIKGTVCSAYDNSLLYNAVIETNTGISARTSSGSFYFRVPPNFYNIIISAPGYKTNMLSGILASPGQTAIVNICLIPSSTTQGYLEGRILDAASFKPVNGAFIGVDLGGAAVSDDNGYFNMRVPSGTAIVTAAAPSYASKTIQQLTIRSGRTARIVIYLKKKNFHTVAITGLVKNVCTGEKLTDARVLSVTGDFDISSNGSYSLDIESGPSTVIATAQGYQYAYRTGSYFGYFFPAIVNMNLLPSKKSFGLVRGNIHDTLSGDALDGARIASDTGAISFSNSDGSFKLYTSTCTSYITVSKTGFTSAQLSLAVTPGSSSYISIGLDPADVSDNATLTAHDCPPLRLFELANGITAFHGPLIAAYSNRLSGYASELESLIADDAVLHESFLKNYALARMPDQFPSLFEATCFFESAAGQLRDFLEGLCDARLSEGLHDVICSLAADTRDGILFEDIYLVQEY